MTDPTQVFNEVLENDEDNNMTDALHQAEATTGTTWDEPTRTWV